MFFECAQIPLLQPAGVAQCARVGQKLTQQKYIKSGFQLLDFQLPKKRSFEHFEVFTMTI